MFSKRTTAAAALCLSSIVMTGGNGAVTAAPPHPAPEEIVVYPTGDPDVDVAQVQWAVDHSSRVRLAAVDATTGHAAAFDFGPNTPDGQFVVLSRDVEIRGEVVGDAHTVVSGGFLPLRSMYWNPVAVSIRDIEFAAPGAAALFVMGATGVDFIGNHVHGVAPLPDWIPGISKAQGVWVVAPTGSPETITGQIVITDNVIEDVDAMNGYGIALFGFVADARIERNVITGVDTAGILVAEHSGEILIDGNQIRPGLAGYQSAYGHGSGIIVGNARSGVTDVRDNTIDCENPFADGMFVAASRFLFGDDQRGGVIEGNHITLHGSEWGGIGLIGSVEDLEVAHNRIDGAGAFGVYGMVWFTPDDLVSSNRFVGTDVARFTSTIADVVFDVNTVANTYLGRARTVLDLGVANWVSGTSTGPPPFAPHSLGHWNMVRDQGLVPPSLAIAGPAG